MKNDKLHIPIDSKYKDLIRRIAENENLEHIPFCRKIIMDFIKKKYPDELNKLKKEVLQ